MNWLIFFNKINIIIIIIIITTTTILVIIIIFIVKALTSQTEKYSWVF